MHFHPLTVTTHTTTPLGGAWLAASPLGLSGLWFDDQRDLPAAVGGPNAWLQNDTHPVLQAALVQLQEYFRGGRTAFELPLDIACGTVFQQSVWRALQSISHGKTTSYSALSAQIGRPTAVRAVASAIGRNPLSVIIPCHRVLGKNGSLTGYTGGLERKAWLLQFESVV